MHALPPRDGVVNAFTVDVEDYFQVSAFDAVVSRADWSRITPRVQIGLHRLLDLLDRRTVKGTFFILGWIAETHPSLVREIADRGHEVGCHSFEHHLVHSMTPADFRDDLRRALDAIERASGVRCTLYRAPSFSITRQSLWALDVMADEGIRLDSSIFPVRHDRYGIPDAPRIPYRPLAHDPAFVEVPPTSVRVFSTNVPCVGGGYFRLFPLALSLAIIRRLNRQERLPANLYIHPWELDPEQPVIPTRLVTRLRHRIGLSAVERRLEAMIERLPFGTLSESLQSWGDPRPLALGETAPEVMPAPVPSLR